MDCTSVSKVPPLFTVVSLAVPPEATCIVPPDWTSVRSAVAPVAIFTLPPSPMIESSATTSRPIFKIPPLWVKERTKGPLFACTFVPEISIVPKPSIRLLNTTSELWSPVMVILLSNKNPPLNKYEASP